MAIILILFCISLIGLSSMISYRAWELRTGKIDLANIESLPAIPHLKLNIKQIKKATPVVTKYIIHSILLFFAKNYLQLKKFINRVLSERFPRLFANNELNGRTAKPTSFFLRTMAEYKVKLRKMKERMADED